MLTMRDRVASYNAAFREYPASHLHVFRDEHGRDIIRGEWAFGQDYRNKSEFFGAYPGNYLDRLAAVFPEFTIKPDMLLMGTGMVLHAFSGSLAPGPYDRCDIVQPAEHQCDVVELPARVSLPYDLIVADQPYSDEDAARYKAPPLNRIALTDALASVARPRGFLCWLDTVWPMHNKERLVTVGYIYVRRSTNHRIRLLSIFERVAA